MYPFCPHCGQTLDGQQPTGQTLVCRHCGQVIGSVPSTPQRVVVDKTEELLRSGSTARCPLCQQVVELKSAGAAKSFVPHFGSATQRKMCPNSGKQVPASPSAPAVVPSPSPIQRPHTSKDLSAFLTREFIKVISCQRDADPQIEELTLEYLDKKDRVRLQIDALRDILGAEFRLQAYPPQLQRPHLAVWGNASICVVGRKHPQGGYQPMPDEELRQALEEVRQHKPLFFQPNVV